MIGGLFIIIVLFVIRFSDRPMILPENLVLPGNAKAIAYTQGPDWYAIVTDQDQILIYDRASGAVRQTVDITPAHEGPVLGFSAEKTGGNIDYWQ